MLAAATHRAGARPWVWWHTAPRWQRWPVAFVVWFNIVGVFSVAMTGMAYAQCEPGSAGCGLTTGGYTGAGENLLPAYRWSDSASGIYTNFGASDTTSRVLAGIAGLFLAVASIIWRVTLFLLETAISVDVVQNSAEAVNDGYTAIFDAVTTSGITIFVTLFAVMVIGVRVAMGSEQNPGRSLFRLAVAVGLVFMFAQSAATQNPTTSPGAVMVALDDATSVVTEGLLRSFNGIASPPGTNARDQLDCANYTAALYDTYDTNVVRAGTGPRGGLASGSNYREASQAQMSLLWEEAYLTPWTAVQFGDPGMGRVMRCRFLETDTAVPSIQADVHRRSGATMPTGDGDDDDHSVFNQNRNGQEFRRNMAAWATCGRRGGEFFIRSPWATVNGGPDNGGPEVEECEEWYNEGNTEPGDNPGPWHIEERSDIGEATDGSFADCEEGGGGGGSIDDDEDGGDSCGGDESQPAPRARTFYNHLNGHVGGAGVGASLLAMVVAGVFAWALIGLSLGLIIAQFGIILAFICLPIWLLVRAWPGDSAAEISKKMSRVGVGMLFSKVVFVIALGILIVFMSALRGVADASGLTAMQSPAGGLTGADAITSSLVIGLIPLASVILLRKAGEAIGLKGLGTLKGTASLVANAANPNGGPGQGLAAADRLGRRARNAVGREVRMRRQVHRQQKLRDKRDDEREKRKGQQGQIGDADADTKPAGEGKDKEKGKGKGGPGGPRAALSAAGAAAKKAVGGGEPTGSPKALPGAEESAAEVQGPGRGRRALATVAGAAAAVKAVPLVGAAAYALGAAGLGSLAPAAIGVVGGVAAYKGVKRFLAPKEVPLAVEGAATGSRDRFVADTEREVPDAVVEPEAPYTWERASGGGWVPTDPRPADGPAPVVEPASVVDPGPSVPPVTGRRPG